MLPSAEVDFQITRPGRYINLSTIGVFSSIETLEFSPMSAQQLRGFHSCLDNISKNLQNSHYIVFDKGCDWLNRAGLMISALKTSQNLLKTYLALFLSRHLMLHTLCILVSDLSSSVVSVLVFEDERFSFIRR